MMSYLNPRKVTAPREQWELIDILYDKGEEDHSVALGLWEGTLCMACRWNGCTEDKKRKKGNPISNFQPTWFILPRPIAEAIYKELVKSSERDKSINSDALIKAAAIFKE